MLFLCAGVQASEVELIDAINAIAVSQRWALHFSPDNGYYYLETTRFYDVGMDSGNHPVGSEEQRVVLAFRIYHYASDAALRDVYRKMQQELDGLQTLAKDIPQKDWNMAMHYMARNGTEQVLVNRIEVLDYLILNRPTFHYKDDLYVAVSGASPVWPGNNADTAAKTVIAEHDRVLALLRELP